MKHEVRVAAGGLRLDRSTIEIMVEREGKRYGTLKVGTGSLVWVPYDRTYGYRIAWDQMNDLAQQIGLREEPRKANQTRTKAASNGSASAASSAAIMELPQRADTEPLKLIRVTDEGEDTITLRRIPK